VCNWAGRCEEARKCQCITLLEQDPETSNIVAAGLPEIDKGTHHCVPFFSEPNEDPGNSELSQALSEKKHRAERRKHTEG